MTDDPESCTQSARRGRRRVDTDGDVGGKGLNIRRFAGITRLLGFLVTELGVEPLSQDDVRICCKHTVYIPAALYAFRLTAVCYVLR
jgi:hypothetical protein